MKTEEYIVDVYEKLEESEDKFEVCVKVQANNTAEAMEKVEDFVAKKYGHNYYCEKATKCNGMEEEEINLIDELGRLVKI